MKARRRMQALGVFALLVVSTSAAGRAARSTGLPSSATLQALSARTRAAGLSPDVLGLALEALSQARAEGLPGRTDVLTVIDYSLPSTERRLWVLDLARGRVLYRELVAHGVGSGENYARHFSNLEGSRETSLGLFRTGATYQGKNGYSLRLRGLEPGVNDRAFARTIVIHGAWYVSRRHADRWGRLGRSWGCPALPLADAHRVIDTIKGGSFLFAYYPEDEWLERSTFLAEAAPSGGGSATGRAAVSAPR